MLEFKNISMTLFITSMFSTISTVMKISKKKNKIIVIVIDVR